MSTRIPQVSMPQVKALVAEQVASGSPEALVGHAKEYAKEVGQGAGELAATAFGAVVGAGVGVLDQLSMPDAQRAALKQGLFDAAAAHLGLPAQDVAEKLGQAAEAFRSLIRGGERPLVDRNTAHDELVTSLQQLGKTDDIGARTLCANWLRPVGGDEGGSEVWAVHYGDVPSLDDSGSFYAVVVARRDDGSYEKHLIDDGRFAVNYFQPVEGETVGGHVSTYGELLGTPVASRQNFEGDFIVLNGELRSVRDFQNVLEQRFENGAMFAIQEKDGRWWDAISFGPSAKTDKAADAQVNWEMVLIPTGGAPTAETMKRVGLELPEVAGPFSPSQATAQLLERMTDRGARDALHLVFERVGPGALESTDPLFAVSPAAQDLFAAFLEGGPLRGAFGLVATADAGTIRLGFPEGCPPELPEQAQVGLRGFLAAMERATQPVT